MSKFGILMVYIIAFLFNILMFLYPMKTLTEPFYEYHAKCLHKSAQKESNRLHFTSNFLVITFSTCLDYCKYNQICIFFSYAEEKLILNKKSIRK